MRRDWPTPLRCLWWCGRSRTFDVLNGNFSSAHCASARAGGGAEQRAAPISFLRNCFLTWSTAAMAAAHLGGRLRQHQIATARTWPSDVLALCNYALATEAAFIRPFLPKRPKVLYVLMNFLAGFRSYWPDLIFPVAGFETGRAQCIDE